MEDAVAGAAYHVSAVEYGAVMHRAGEGPRERSGRVACAICIREESPVRLIGIPEAVQRDCEVGSASDAVFEPYQPHFGSEFRVYDDRLRFANGHYAWLAAVAGPTVKIELVAVESAVEAPASVKTRELVDA